VRRELDAPERAVERASERLGEHCLAHARDVLDQQVTLAEQGHEAEADLVLFIDDRPAHIGLDRVRDAGYDIDRHQPTLLPLMPCPITPGMLGIIGSAFHLKPLYVRMPQLVPIGYLEGSGGVIVLSR